MVPGRALVLLLCVPLFACYKQKTEAADPELMGQAAAKAGGDEARVQEAQAMGIPPRTEQQATASVGTASGAAMGSRPSGTVPGANVAPGQVKAVKPSQGTVQPRVTTPPQAPGPELMIEQGTSSADRNMAHRIKDAIKDNPSLSYTAKTVQIITRDGNVALRGLVLSDQEKSIVEDVARSYAGSGSVMSFLEVKPVGATP